MASAASFFSSLHARLIKLTGGKALMAGGEDGNALVLTHIGAKSGKRRDTPLTFLHHNDGYAIIGSVAGSDQHPGWYYNLRANPNTEVYVAGETIPVTARLTTGEERQALWQRFVAVNEGFANYTRKTDREFPIFVLERSD